MKLLLGILKRGWKEEQGQAIVLAAVGMVALLAFTGLAIDVGQLRYAQRELQSAADASAIAGALELSYCGSSADCTTMQNAAKQAIVENGYSGATVLTNCTARTGTGLTLAVNNGPCALGSSDPNYNNAKYVETVVTKSQPTFFAGVIGIDSMTLSARAEATMGNDPYCLDVGKGGITLNSGAQLSLSCGIMDAGQLMADGGSHVTSTSFDVAGGITINGNDNNLSPYPNPVSSALPDPLAGVPAPDSEGCSSTLNVNGNLTIDHGTYCGININSGTLTLNPGTYVFDGSVNIDSGASITGNGVTLYFSSGTLQMNSGTNLTLVAPTTGPYAGILMYESPSDSSEFIMDSGSQSTWQGAIYLPNATIDINSGGNLAAYTIIDAYAVTVDSGGQLGDNYSSLPNGSPAKAVTAVLVE